METLNLKTVRAQCARFGKQIGSAGYIVALALWILLGAGGISLVASGHRYGFSLGGIALFALMFAIWWKRSLSVIPVAGSELNDRLSIDVLVHLRPSVEYNPHELWEAIKDDWQVSFLCNHLFVHPDDISELLKSDEHLLLSAIWPQALRLADRTHCAAVEPGHIATALVLASAEVNHALTRHKLHSSDVEAVMDWLGRGLAIIRREKPRFGGLGRDWANGFTPQLERFGYNISLAIERYNIPIGTLGDSDGVNAIKTAFSQGASAVALIGADGIGKTSHAYALAQSLLAETKDRKLEHHQIVELDPSSIISAAQRPGELEYIVTMLLNEAAHAGNIILFMDNAQLFFQDGNGSFNATQILLPVVQSHAIQFVLTLTPSDYQRLKTANSAFAGLLTPVVLREPNQALTLEVLTSKASQMELKHQLLITYPALKETYRLSGRYEQDFAYPGKAVRLLEQSLTHAQHDIVSPESVQAAIEQMTGVKTGAAAPIETDQLLNLEDRIHERMINQSRAVSVVANALRRSRAGVSSPNRPIGSFLFLGPTGVGKTELAKSIAATYFNDEDNMIRLDMSEYQQASDVSRLLDSNGSLFLKMRERPFSVLLLDEIEKSHSNILNLLLQMLDEGKLTDGSGRVVSFKDAIIIATSNAGAAAIRQHIEQGEQLESFERQFVDDLITSNQFKPELLNRFDEIVLFRPLNEDELGQVVRLMLGGTNKALATQNIRVELTDAAVAKIVAVGNDPRLGARPMRRALQRAVEDTVAQRILRGEAQAGDTITLDAGDLTV